MERSKGVMQFLEAHSALKPVSFHMPGHKGSGLFKRTGCMSFMKNIADYDITEIPGADNLFQAESIIKETADKYKKLYDVRKSYLLINGTSGGILASVMTSVPKGKKLILARNCHKSVFNAMTLGGIEPVYAYPDLIEDQGISGAVSPVEIGRLLDENPDAEAVILPSPNYYGICSDIKAIAETVHEHGKILIVDQAHGAHLKFFEEHKHSRGKVWSMPKSAESCGADFVINSTHKTLASFTQSAVLNVCTDRGMELLNVLEDKLQAVESTSPSYLLMASLDINADIIKSDGRKLFNGWRKNIRWFYNKVSSIEELKIMNTENLDTTKINIDLSAVGISGAELEEILISYNIFPELVTGSIVMCMSGIGNTKSDYKKLYSALKQIAQRAKAKSTAGSTLKGTFKNDSNVWATKRALFALSDERELVSLKECGGRIAAASVIPYPPGIPLICPGEKIDVEDCIYIASLREQGEKVIGVDEEGRIWVQKRV